MNIPKKQLSVSVCSGRRPHPWRPNPNQGKFFLKETNPKIKSKKQNEVSWKIQSRNKERWDWRNWNWWWMTNTFLPSSCKITNLSRFFRSAFVVLFKPLIYLFIFFLGRIFFVSFLGQTISLPNFSLGLKGTTDQGLEAQLARFAPFFSFRLQKIATIYLLINYLFIYRSIIIFTERRKRNASFFYWKLHLTDDKSAVLTNNVVNIF